MILCVLLGLLVFVMMLGVFYAVGRIAGDSNWVSCIALGFFITVVLTGVGILCFEIGCSLRGLVHL
jgi:hypothetical protein